MEVCLKGNGTKGESLDEEVRKIKVREDGERRRVENENIVNSVCGEGKIRSIDPPLYR